MVLNEVEEEARRDILARTRSEDGRNLLKAICKKQSYPDMTM